MVSGRSGEGWVMKYNCDICGKECEFDFIPKKDQKHFAVCNECSDIMEPGVYTEKD